MNDQDLQLLQRRYDAAMQPIRSKREVVGLPFLIAIAGLCIVGILQNPMVVLGVVFGCVIAAYANIVLVEMYRSHLRRQGRYQLPDDVLVSLIFPFSGTMFGYAAGLVLLGYSWGASILMTTVAILVVVGLTFLLQVKLFGMKIS